MMRIVRSCSCKEFKNNHMSQKAMLTIVANNQGPRNVKIIKFRKRESGWETNLKQRKSLIKTNSHPSFMNQLTQIKSLIGSNNKESPTLRETLYSRSPNFYLALHWILTQKKSSMHIVSSFSISSRAFSRSERMMSSRMMLVKTMIYHKLLSILLT